MSVVEWCNREGGGGGQLQGLPAVDPLQQYCSSRAMISCVHSTLDPRDTLHAPWHDAPGRMQQGSRAEGWEVGGR